MDILQLWQLLAHNPLNITFTFNIQFSTESLGTTENIKEFLSIDPLAPSEESLEEYDDEPLGFDISKIVGFL